MTNHSDQELLQKFCASQDEEAFRHLMERHVDVLYSSAIKQTHGDTELARDVLQSVFIDLSRKAGTLTDRSSVVGWLFTSVHFAASKAIRSEQRRRQREQVATTDLQTQEETMITNDSLDPQLEEVLRQLPEMDRSAILLRFFEKLPLKGVGVQLGVSEEAARKRVDRALDRMRELFLARGTTTSVAALTTTLSATVITQAPAALIPVIVSSVMVNAGTTGLGVTSALALTKFKIAGATALAALAVMFPLWQQHKVNGHQKQIIRLEAEAKERAASTLRQKEEYEVKLQAATAALVKSQSQLQELATLRAEVTRLRRELNEKTQEKKRDAELDRPSDQEPVKTIEGKARIMVAKNESALLGGWDSSRGKKLALLVQPTTPADFGPGIILVSSWFIEMPAAEFEKLKIPSEGHLGLTPESQQRLMDYFLNTEGIDVIAAPRMANLSGRQGQISATEETPIEGQLFTTGATLELITTQLETGFELDLTTKVVRPSDPKYFRKRPVPAPNTQD